jgi:hypothetical protein
MVEREEDEEDEADEKDLKKGKADPRLDNKALM